MRAAIFVDGGYFLNLLKLSRISADYSRIAEHFLAPLRANLPIDLLRCYFYYCAPYMSQEPTEDELRRMETHKEFMNLIEAQSRWQVRLGKLEKRWDGNREYYEQKRVDVLLSCDLVRHTAAGHIQHAVLIAGDSDFIPAVSSAKESGATVTLWCGPSNTVHKDLIAQADEVHLLDWGRMPKLAQPAPERGESRQVVPAQPSTAVAPVVEGESSSRAAPSGGRASSGSRRRGRRPARAQGPAAPAASAPTPEATPRTESRRSALQRKTSR